MNCPGFGLSFSGMYLLSSQNRKDDDVFKSPLNCEDSIGIKGGTGALYGDGDGGACVILFIKFEDGTRRNIRFTPEQALVTGKILIDTAKYSETLTN